MRSLWMTLSSIELNSTLDVMMLWSETGAIGIGVFVSMDMSCEVKMRSRIFFFRVGLAICCERLNSVTREMSRSKAWC